MLSKKLHFLLHSNVVYKINVVVPENVINYNFGRQISDDAAVNIFNQQGIASTRMRSKKTHRTIV